MDGVMCSIMTWKVTLSMWIKVDKIAVCGSCSYAFESTNHVPRNMVSGKPSNQSARGVDIPPTTCNLVFHTHRRAGVRSAQQTGVQSCSRAIDVRPTHCMCVWSCSRLWWPWSTSRNERQTVAPERSLDVPSMWVRFTLTRLWNSIQNRPFLVEIETAYSFCHIE
jgi:hypothetical protein